MALLGQRRVAVIVREVNGQVKRTGAYTLASLTMLQGCKGGTSDRDRRWNRDKFPPIADQGIKRRQRSV
jgi:hypothetical protein